MKVRSLILTILFFGIAVFLFINRVPDIWFVMTNRSHLVETEATYVTVSELNELTQSDSLKWTLTSMSADCYIYYVDGEAYVCKLQTSNREKPSSHKATIMIYYDVNDPGQVYLASNGKLTRLIFPVFFLILGIWFLTGCFVSKPTQYVSRNIREENQLYADRHDGGRE